MSDNNQINNIGGIVAESFYTTRDDLIVIPSDKNRDHYYAADLSFSLPEEAFYTDIYLVDSSTGFKYSLEYDYYSTYSETLRVYFYTNYQSGEDAKNLDTLEISLTTVYTGNKIVAHGPVTVVKEQRTSASFIYNKNRDNNVETNLLSHRVNLGSASWSTMRKDILANGNKMLAPLHAIFNNSYAKVNSYLKQAYSNSTELEYERVLLSGRPTNIVRQDNNIDLVEVNSIQNGPRIINRMNVYGNQLVYTVFEPYSSNEAELEVINGVMGDTLYIRNDSSNEDKYLICLIKGMNYSDEYIEETLLVRKDVYTKVQNRYKTILSIEHNNKSIEVANYVDLRYNHYVITNPHIVPAISDADYRSFKPLIKKESNEENNRDVLSIYNPINDATESSLRFNFEDDAVIGSLFVTEDLDVIYTAKYPERESQFVSFSKLCTDYSKKTFANKTLNNNEFISVSNTNTNKGDWVDVSINTGAWVEYSGDQVFSIQVRNGSSILYYDLDTKSLSTSRVLIYNQTLTTDLTEFSVEVENDQPYTFSIIDSKVSKKATASTYVDEIKPYYQESTDMNNYLIYYNDQVTVYYEGGVNISHQNEDESLLKVIITPNNLSTIDYDIYVGDYEINESDSNISSEYLRYIKKDNSYGEPVILLIDIDQLGIENISIGVYSSQYNGIVNSEHTCQVGLVYKNKINTFETTVNNPIDRSMAFANNINIRDEYLNWEDF